jgi:hypothetical protein
MNDIKDAVNGEAPPVARVGGDRLDGAPPPVTPRFLQHVQAAAPRCNTSRNFMAKPLKKASVNNPELKILKQFKIRVRMSS